MKIDLSKSDFDLAIPPGGKEAVRKIINDEVVIDYSSAQPLLEFFTEAKKPILWAFEAMSMYSPRQY